MQQAHLLGGTENGYGTKLSFTETEKGKETFSPSIKTRLAPLHRLEVLYSSVSSTSLSFVEGESDGFSHLRFSHASAVGGQSAQLSELEKGQTFYGFTATRKWFPVHKYELNRVARKFLEMMPAEHLHCKSSKST